MAKTPQQILDSIPPELRKKAETLVAEYDASGVLGMSKVQAIADQLSEHEEDEEA